MRQIKGKKLDNSSRDNIQIIGVLEIKTEKKIKGKKTQTPPKQNKTIKNFPQLKPVSSNAKRPIASPLTVQQEFYQDLH